MYLGISAEITILRAGILFFEPGHGFFFEYTARFVVINFCMCRYTSPVVHVLQRAKTREERRNQMCFLNARSN